MRASARTRMQAYARTHTCSHVPNARCSAMRCVKMPSSESVLTISVCVRDEPDSVCVANALQNDHHPKVPTLLSSDVVHWVHALTHTHARERTHAFVMSAFEYVMLLCFCPHLVCECVFSGRCERETSSSCTHQVNCVPLTVRRVRACACVGCHERVCVRVRAYSRSSNVDKTRHTRTRACTHAQRVAYLHYIICFMFMWRVAAHAVWLVFRCVSLH